MLFNTLIVAAGLLASSTVALPATVVVERQALSCRITADCSSMSTISNSKPYCNPKTKQCQLNCLSGYTMNPWTKDCQKNKGKSTTTTTTRAPVSTTTTSSPPASTAISCSITADCTSAETVVPFGANRWCNAAEGVCSWRCGSKFVQSGQTCVAKTGGGGTSAPAQQTTVAPQPVPQTTTTTAQSSTSSVSVSPVQTFTGWATYFWQNGNYGNCGIKSLDSSSVVALPTKTYANGIHCGQQVRITRKSTGKTIIATVQDSCPTCVTNTSLDLSYGAFIQLATEEEGMVEISWSWV
ncbi:hypothetical protein ACM66B_005333 [Microbotryomycetes sp. NB124-2]